MARKRGKPNPPDRKGLRARFLEHFAAAKVWVTTLPLQAPAEVASVVALSAISGAYPDVNALTTLGLGTISGLWANYLSKTGGAVTAAVPPELIRQFLAHDQAQRELAEFLKEYDLRSVMVKEFGETALHQLKTAVGQVLDQHDVARREHLAPIEDGVGQLLHRVKPPSPPTIHNMLPANPNFTGREKQLEDLRASLLDGGTAALTQLTQHQAITGLGGVGKTQLAIEYAHRHHADYRIIWWVRSEEPAQLAEGFAGLAKALDLPEKDQQDQRVVTQAVCLWLESNGNWLLVFDNVPHPGSVEGYRPGGGRGHVIITSRDPDWAGVAKPLLVEVWPRNESVEFLGKRLGRTDEAAGELAKELGDLPLALEQAAAYLENSGMSLEEYLTLYRERREELWPNQPPPHDYRHTVTTTWDMAMTQLQEDEPAAASLLNLLAFLAPDDIPRSLIAEGAEHLPDPLAEAARDPIALNRAIAALRHYSLLTTKDDALSLHRLVQHVTRDRLSEEERKEWAGAAVRLLNAAFPFKQNDPATWPASGRLLPHALAAAEHAVDAHIGGVEPPRLLSQAGLYLRLRAEFAQARDVLARAVTAAEQTYGDTHTHVASCANNLGLVLREMGDLQEAKACYERALAIIEKAYGPDHPNVATTVNNLGAVLRGQGDLGGAKAHYERALAIDEKAYGPDHPDVATDVNNLGSVLRAQGDLEGAKAHYERALAIDEKTYGSNHPNVAIRVNNLGGVLLAQGDPEGARVCLKRALAIFRQFLGEEHPNTQLVRENLEALDKR